MSDKTKKIVIAIVAIIAVILIGVIIWLGYKLNEKNKESVLASENLYNSAIYELADYMENVENYLAKATITTSATHGAETLTSLWREANLAQTYLSMLPIESQELESTAKFLNQVSDYSYSLSRKNIKGEKLTEDDLKNLETFHKYSTELSNAVNQLIEDLNVGSLKWKDLTSSKDENFAQEVNVSFDFASTLEENFHEYSGLIYDGAFSEHITSKEKKGLTGDKISEEDGAKKVKEFIGEENIKEISNLGYSENASAPVYTYSVKTNKEDNVTITISETGGHIVYMNSNREVSEEKISSEEANDKGKAFLEQKGFSNMEQTYFLKNEGVITINYAYLQNGVIMYPDLIKLKIALDDGEILGMETTGYLNNHIERNVSDIGITMEEAKKDLNKNLNIESEKLVVIPTEWESEILCYEFKGKIEDKEYLVYINAKTGDEEDILVITNTPNGTLTM